MQMLVASSVVDMKFIVAGLSMTSLVIAVVAALLIIIDAGDIYFFNHVFIHDDAHRNLVTTVFAITSILGFGLAVLYFAV